MATKRDPDDVILPALLRAARTAYGSAIREALNEAGLDGIPKNGIFVIGAISRTGAPLADIIAELGVSKQSAGQLVDALVENGYLERTADESDRRRVTVSLSKRGRAAAQLSREAVERVDAALIKRVGREAVTHTRTTLLALIALSRGKDSA
jgi:DNA-binding MarR family transcriptional regulator